MNKIMILYRFLTLTFSLYIFSDFVYFDCFLKRLNNVIFNYLGDSC